jgi:hypothetical protein
VSEEKLESSDADGDQEQKQKWEVSLKHGVKLARARCSPAKEALSIRAVR